jgi:hypothetical protein
MVQKQHYADAPASNDTWPADTCILDWIDAWKHVRSDVLQLLADYERADGGHEIGRFLPLLDETDAALRLLKHRVDWLRAHLGHTADTPADRL